MKKIIIIFTGGTFSMRIDESTGGAVPYFSGDELIGMMPGLKGLASVDVFDYGKFPGPHMTPQRMFELSKKVREFAASDEYDGIIVTHGTDTLEETAYFLDLTVKTEKPIVVIGSMKHSGEPDWDGPQNLIDAVRICLQPNCRGIGVLVCLSGEINAASEVTKTHTEDPDTFRSLDFGSLGFVQDGRVILNRLPRKLETILTDEIVDDVDLIKCYAGMGDKFIRLSADSGVAGIVIEAMGVGNVPPLAFDGIKYAVEKGIPVVLVSRCPAGETLDIYSYYGAGKWLHQLGVIFTDFLNGQKARIKLMVSLGKTKSHEELHELFGD